jgi:serine/threonine protein kinase
MRVPERYELVETEPVGQGSMGWIYKAWDTRLGRTVALKLLRTQNSMGDVQMDVSGALREARTLAQISHPAILQVFDVIEAAPDSWIVCEWLEGKSLDRLQLPLHPLAVMAIACEALAALASVHSASVIHRDVKPSNIILCASGRLVLLDFGVAYIPGGSSGVTIAGTPRYSDAGRLEGTPPDERSDLFSMGLVLLELLAGEAVLPSLAPLPLYRYLTQSFSHRVSQMTSGVFPPFADLLEEMLASVERRSNSSEQRGDAEITSRCAARMRQIFHTFVSGSPVAFLRDYVVGGEQVPAELEEKFRLETRRALDDASLSPKLRAKWLSFERRQREFRETLTKVLPAPSRRASFLFWSALIALLVGTVGFWSFRSGSRRGEAPRAVAAAETAAPRNLETPAATPTAVATVVATEPATAVPTVLATVRPNPARPGRIWLAANAWANVYVDGKWVGQLPLATPLSLAPGRHTIRLENPMTKPFEAPLRVDAGTITRHRFTLVPKETPTE